MASVDVPLKRLRFGQTSRRDAWWALPLVTLVVFSSFVAYTTWALIQGDHYWQGNYLSPFYSPELFSPPGALTPHAWFGEAPAWLAGLFPSWLRYSPAMLILIFPLAFRMTCYYYRGAYYKAFWADPPNCTVGEPRKSYLGENKLPLIVQNVHRYALYFALVFIVLLSIDAWHGLWFDDASGGKTFGVGVGSLIMIVNVTLIGGYTLGCHSLRHLVGGVFDLMSGKPIRKKAYDCVSCLNRHHPKWAWCSLVWVAWTDIYIRLCSMGVITDWRII